VLAHTIDISECNPLLPPHNSLVLVSDEDDEMIRHLQKLRDIIRKYVTVPVISNSHKYMFTYLIELKIILFMFL